MTVNTELISIYPFNLARDIFDSEEAAIKIYVPGIYAALATLTERESNVIRLRYTEKMTLKAIGQEHGVTQERQAASMSAVLLAAGQSKKRSALPHARVMIHQPVGGVEGQASDMAIAVKEILELQDQLYRILAEHTGKPLDQIQKDADRDYWMRADDAVAYGIIDEVLRKKQL